MRRFDFKDAVAPVLMGVGALIFFVGIANEKGEAMTHYTLKSTPISYNINKSEIRHAVEEFANGSCVDGFEVQRNESDHLDIYTIPCYGGSNHQPKVHVSIPLCAAEVSVSAYNTQVGIEYAKLETSYLRESFRLNEVGRSAYARYALNSPTYIACSSKLGATE